MKFFQDLCLRSLFVLGYVRMKFSAHRRTFLRFFEEKYQKKKPQGTPGRGGSLRILLAWGIFALEAKMLPPNVRLLEEPA